MAGKRSIIAGRDIIGGVAVTGDNNKVEGKIAVSGAVGPPPASSVDITRALTELRSILSKLGGEHAGKIDRAMEDATEEAKKANPDRDEIGAALGRAIGYAEKTGELAQHIETITPYLRSVVSWLGENWHRLLPLVGLAHSIPL